MKPYLPLLSAIVFSLTACSDDKVAGFSTVETENAMLIQVVNSDSLPVAGAQARVRLARKAYTNDDAIAVLNADSDGFIAFDSAAVNKIEALSVDSIAVEILDSEKRGAFATLDWNELSDSTRNAPEKMVLYHLQYLKGRVENAKAATVYLYGTSKSAKVDSLGNFVIEGVAPGDYTYLVASETDSLTGSVSVHKVAIDDDCEALECTETRLNVVFGTDSVNVDTTQNDTLENIGYVEIINFENGFQSSLKAPALEGTGYFAVSDSTVESTPIPETSEEGFVEAGAGREGTAYHWTSNSPNGRWAFFGIFICRTDTPCDMQGLDSVEFYVRGKGRYSFAVESLGDSTFNGKAIYHDTLKVDSTTGRNDAETWIRKVVRPSDFIEGDSSWGNLGWELISQKVTTLTIATYGEAEIWIDDIKLYGIKPSDMK